MQIPDKDMFIIMQVNRDNRLSNTSFITGYLPSYISR